MLAHRLASCRAALYAAAGFHVARVTPLQDNFGTSIVEGVNA
jgi:hypothetical protein